MPERIRAIFRFYADGFRNMTWGRPLWLLIILKLVILFLVLRLFFFRPVLAGKSEAEKSDFVGGSLLERTSGGGYGTENEVRPGQE